MPLFVAPFSITIWGKSTLLSTAYWDEDYKFKWNMTKEEWEDDENFSQIESYVHDQRKRLKFEGYSF